MRVSLLTVGMILLAVVQSFAATVIYDLSEDPGIFGCQVIQQFKSPVPLCTSFCASSPNTNVYDIYAHDTKDVPLKVQLIEREHRIVQADLNGISIENDNSEVVMGAIYDDWDSLQYTDDRLMFTRKTNIDEIQIKLPADYAVIYADQASIIEYSEDGRVILNIKNPERKLMTVTIVAHRIWGQSSVLAQQPETLSAE